MICSRPTYFSRRQGEASKLTPNCCELIKCCPEAACLTVGVGPYSGRSTLRCCCINLIILTHDLLSGTKGGEDVYHRRFDIENSRSAKQVDT